jgi:hypothetical protein
MLAVFTILLIARGLSQTPSRNFREGLKIYTSDDSSTYIKGTALAQIWFRYNTSNPGTRINGTPRAETFDVGLRRVRYQIMSQLTRKVFLYTQIGINSGNSVAARKPGLFFHDVTAEYNIYKNLFTLGGGLSGWNGTSRYSSSGVSNILGLDLPVIQETTNDVTDQFVRKMGVYAKGKLGRFDYRISAANPYPVQSSLSPVAELPVGSVNTAYYSTRAPELQYQGYFMWQFLDQESNLLPYMAGSYLGTKKVLNIGSGFSFQKNAMWYRNYSGDTVSTASQQLGVDVFYDSYIDKAKRNAVTIYASYLDYNFGPNYIRNAGAMNPANQVSGKSSFNGAGNAFPLIGTGQVLYAQCAYLFRKDLFKDQGTLQPYASGIYARYERLNDPMLVYDIGMNWLISGNSVKISLDYQSRPIFAQATNGTVNEIRNARRGQLTMQFQAAF